MYKQTKWIDHVTQYEDRFTETNNGDGTVTHVPVEGEVIQQGTPQNAQNFNNMEYGIFGANEMGGEAIRGLLHAKQTIKKLVGAVVTTTLNNTAINMIHLSQHILLLHSSRFRYVQF